MKRFFAFNATPNLVPKVISLGFSEAYTFDNVLEAQNADSLVKLCKQKKTIFVNPLSCPDYYKSRALIEIAREKDKVFEIPLCYLLRSTDKSKVLFQLKAFLANCIKRKVKFFFSSRASNEFELKSPREIIAIGQTLGLTYEQAAAAISLDFENSSGELLK